VADEQAPSLEYGPNPAVSAQAGLDQRGGPQFSQHDYDPAGFSPHSDGTTPPKAKAKAKAKAEDEAPARQPAPPPSPTPAEDKTAPAKEPEPAPPPSKTAPGKTPPPEPHHRSSGGRAGHRP